MEVVRYWNFSWADVVHFPYDYDVVQIAIYAREIYMLNSQEICK